MAIVSPSILSADFGKLGADCRMVLDAGAQMLHYDVMDGHFVPNISFGVPVLKSLHKALPDAFYDVHLMISHPLQYAEPFIKAGATLYNFHLECEDDIQATIDAVRALGCKVGLTIKPRHSGPRRSAPWLGAGWDLGAGDERGARASGGQKFMALGAGQAPLAQGRAGSTRPFLPGWRWTAAWMPPPHPCAWKPVPMCWWQAVPCSAPPTLLRLWAHWPACKEGCIWMKL